MVTAQIRAIKTLQKWQADLVNTSDGEVRHVLNASLIHFAEEISRLMKAIEEDIRKNAVSLEEVLRLWESTVTRS